MSETKYTTKNEEFKPAREGFESLINELVTENALKKEHGDIESLLYEDGMELLRKLLQAHLTIRTQRETKQNSVINSEGEKLTHCRKNCSRKLETKFGEVIVQRIGYSLPSCKSIFPLDAELNLPPNKYSHGLQKIVAEEAAKSSFDEVVETVDKLTCGHVPKRQAEELTPAITKDFDLFYEKKRM